MKGSTANCKACKETPEPDYYGSPRKCAFDENGIFTEDNWNCVTANALRLLAGESSHWGENHKESDENSFYVYRNDRSYAALWIPSHPNDIPDGKECGPFRGGGFIAMYWSKHRGQTEGIIRVDARDGGQWKDAGLPLTVTEVEAALENLTIAAGLSATVI